MRLMAEFNLKNDAWNGPEDDKLQIISEALRIVENGLNDLHAALLEREQGKSPI